VYAGARRTPVCALATSLPWRGALTGLAAELFASTWDVFLILDRLPEEPDRRDTADGRPATAAFARARLARMVGADAESFSEADARELAHAAQDALLRRLVTAARRVCGVAGPGRAVLAGSGAFLAHDIADALEVPAGSRIDLAELWGPRGSEAACAVAVSYLASVEAPSR
jgi:uncharacterized hydantoinase/oxoprolinase family protein